MDNPFAFLCEKNPLKLSISTQFLSKCIELWEYHADHWDKLLKISLHSVLSEDKRTHFLKNEKTWLSSLLRMVLVDNMKGILYYIME